MADLTVARDLLASSLRWTKRCVRLSRRQAVQPGQHSPLPTTMLDEPPVEDRMAFAENKIGYSLAAFWGGHPALGDGDFWLTLHDGAAWDASAGTWQTITDPGLPGTYRDTFATWSANGQLYVWGGTSLEDNGDFNWFVDGAAWNGATATWQPLPPAPVSRMAAVALSTGCDSIVYGGQTAGSTVDNGGAILRD